MAIVADESRAVNQKKYGRQLYVSSEARAAQLTKYFAQNCNARRYQV